MEQQKCLGLTTMKTCAMEQNVLFVNKGIIKDILRDLQTLNSETESRKEDNTTFLNPIFMDSIQA